MLQVRHPNVNSRAGKERLSGSTESRPTNASSPKIEVVERRSAEPQARPFRPVSREAFGAKEMRAMMCISEARALPRT